MSPETIIPVLGIMTGIIIPVSVFIWLYFESKDKNKTIIGKNSFIGSNSTIIAPIKIGDEVTLGAGSVFNQDVPDNSLSIGRARQIIKGKKKS